MIKWLKCFFGPHQTYISRVFKDAYTPYGYTKWDVHKIQCLNCSKVFGRQMFNSDELKKWSHPYFLSARTIEIEQVLDSAKQVDAILKKAASNDH